MARSDKSVTAVLTLLNTSQVACSVSTTATATIDSGFATRELTSGQIEREVAANGTMTITTTYSVASGCDLQPATLTVLVDGLGSFRSTEAFWPTCQAV